MPTVVVVQGELWARYQGRQRLEVAQADDDLFADAKAKAAELELFRKEGFSADSSGTNEQA